MTQFYSYIHCKPDGEPFYIGKGQRSRSHKLTTGRNHHHKNIVSKYGKENIVIWKFDCDSEQSAFTLEKYLIAHYRRVGIKICNRTDGGEGSTGYIASNETREKQRINLTGKVFGSWTVIGFSETRRIGGAGALKPFWKCHCNCGTEREVEGSSLRKGSSIGCGCTKRIAISKAQMGTKKGKKQSPEHIAKRTNPQIGRRWTSDRRASSEAYHSARKNGLSS